MRTLLLIVSIVGFLHAGFDVDHVTVVHQGQDGKQEITVKRESLQWCKYPTSVDHIFGGAKVSKNCTVKVPSFAGRIQPMQIDPKIQTVGELEVLEFMRADGFGKEKLLVDARGRDWVMENSIPASVNISHDSLEYHPFFEDQYEEILKQLGIVKDGEEYSFDSAKELIVYCNGKWCPQSTWFINNLLEIGYPKDLLHWYRGGMLSWMSVGLTTVE